MADVGRLLSRSRNRQGLSLQDVGMRTGIPVDQLRAAETGVLDRPDGLATLKTVRRYADFLGLPGDRFALAILERWPTKGGVPAFQPAAPSGAPDTDGPQLTGPTASVPALGPLTIPGDLRDAGGQRRAPAATDATRENAVHDARPAADGGKGHHDEPTQGIEAVLPAGGLRLHDASASGAHWGAYSETGVTPAVRAPAGHVRTRRRNGVPLALQVVVVVVTLAVLAGVALLAVDRLKPSWLRAVGLTRGQVPAATGPTSTGSSASTGSHSTGSHSTGSAGTPTGSAGTPSGSPAAGSASATPPARATSAAVLRPHTSKGVTVFTVPAPTFNATIKAPGGPCWVDVTTNTSTSPAYTGVIPAGGSKTFSHVHSLSAELAATSGRLSLTSSGGKVTTYAPRGKYPFHVVVHSGH